MQKLFSTAAFRVVLCGVMLAVSPVLLLSLQSDPGSPLPPLRGLHSAGSGLGLTVAAFGIGLMLGASKSVWSWLGCAFFAIVSVELVYAVFTEPVLRFSVFVALAASVWFGDRFQSLKRNTRATS